jgi:hypothetical protein
VRIGSDELEAYRLPVKKYKYSQQNGDVLSLYLLFSRMLFATGSFLALFLLASNVSAAGLTSLQVSAGAARYIGSSEQPDAQFSVDAFSATIDAIISTSHEGPNRTQALPLPKIYGVNIGGWLVLEPWMLRASMGGETCGDCSCISSEWQLGTKLG